MPDFVPHTEHDVSAMLTFLGLRSAEELFAAIPAAIRLGRPLDLDPALSEADLVASAAAIGERNAGQGSLVCFAGGGSYDHEIPAVTRALAGRSEFVTAYTPYQPEVAQGVLQALFEYQTFVARITGMDISNSSLYDGGSALVEAVNLAAAETGRQRVLVSRATHPHWRAMLETFSRGTGHRLELVELEGGRTDWGSVGTEPAACLIASFPNYLGSLEQLSDARAAANRVGGLLVVCQDPIAAGLLRSPGSFGADVVVGEAQALGTALSFGGPYLGFVACRDRLVRRLPGRLVGETLDTAGRRAYVTTLRAREQDIRREKASSNVCTNETLMAVTAAIQLGWLGTAGIREVALRCARAARYGFERLTELEGVSPAVEAPFFREFPLRLPIPASLAIERLLEEGILGGIALGDGFERSGLDGCLLVAFTERRTRAEIDHFADSLRKVIG